MTAAPLAKLILVLFKVVGHEEHDLINIDFRKTALASLNLAKI